MARSPLTLAAAVTSALPRVGVVGAGALTEGSSGRYDSAIADLDDGRRVVVRAPVDNDAAQELAAQSRALRALTPGVRNLLPFRAPELLGEAALRDGRVTVVDFLPGYRVDAAHLPPGRGAATSLGAALAALHALPASVVRAEGLPVRSPEQIRADAARLADRAAATGSVPAALIVRWRRAMDEGSLWRFESSVVLGGATAAAFLFEDVHDVPRVTGLLDWHGLSVGDPAVDLQWLASAPDAADDVFAAYVGASDRAPDAAVRERARLYAELEFARWLVHGHDEGREDIVHDATALLESLSSSVRGLDFGAGAGADVDDAIALLGRVPGGASHADTSMQTDAYDPGVLGEWVGDDGETGPVDVADPPAQASEPTPSVPRLHDPETIPQGDDELEAERASRAAFQRWTSSASE
ncbi:phosphotransferase [Microbacterium aureliae]